MSPALVISRREIRTYFNSPVAYIVVTVFTVLTGYLFFTQLFVEKQADMRGFFGSMPLLFMFLAPAITMRLLADEKASGHAGAADHHAGARLGGGARQVPGGDGAAVHGARADGGRSRSPCELLGPLDRGPTIGGYIGLVLMGGAYIAIGVMTLGVHAQLDRGVHRRVRDLVRAVPVRPADAVRAAVAAAGWSRSSASTATSRTSVAASSTRATSSTTSR